MLLRLITKCWSTGAVSNVSINKLGGRFDLSRLEGKIMNIDSDVVEGRLKATPHNYNFTALADISRYCVKIS